MVITALNQSEIFCLSPEGNQGLSLLYSPLAGKALLADYAMITRAEKACLKHPGSPLPDEMFRPLLDFIPVKERNPIASDPAQLSSLTILRLPEGVSSNLTRRCCWALSGIL